MLVFLTVLHVLAGATWLGAMVYSLLVLQPRARRFFPRPEDYETFIVQVSAGMRWPVLAAFALLAASGTGLVLLHGSAFSFARAFLLGSKTLLFFAALALFSYVSWRMWPARILALPEELAAVRAKFRRVGGLMLFLVGLNMVLGVVLRTLP